MFWIKDISQIHFFDYWLRIYFFCKKNLLLLVVVVFMQHYLFQVLNVFWILDFDCSLRLLDPTDKQIKN